MRIEEDIKLDYENVLFKPKRSTIGSRSEVDLTRNYKFRNSANEYTGIPVMAANMDGVGTFAMALELSSLGLFTCLRKNYDEAALVDFFSPNHKLRTEYTALSFGISTADHDKFRRVYKLIEGALKYVCIDVANGYTKYFSDFIAQFRQDYPNLIIIAGNVVTADQTQELVLNGADIVKVGIGPGSVCTTRIQTGVGYPQLSAVIECADAAHGLGGHIIADGGCTNPGDVAKAFGGGADFVMLGGMLAGHDEGGGKLVDGFVEFYGMSSETANQKYFGGLRKYRSSEGRTVRIPHRGPIASTIQDILGGIRSACSYVGAQGLKQLSKCTTFIRCYGTHNRVHEHNEAVAKG